MRFTVLLPKGQVPEGANAAFLRPNSQNARLDDGFQTSFDLYYRDADGTIRYVGETKIGRYNLGQVGHPNIPREFDQLDDQCFSLGQDDSYYVSLNDLGHLIRDEVLTALNDIAVDPDLFARALGETVTRKSLLRNVSPTTVRNQFHRLALGGVRLSEYEFTYTYPAPPDRLGPTDPPKLYFRVVPESQPPTNVHVIIGQNGVGKSRLLKRLANALIRPETRDHGRIDFLHEAGSSPLQWASREFASLVSVAFSAFDDFEPVRGREDNTRGLRYTYIGLRENRGIPVETGMKAPWALAAEFADSVRICVQGARLARWRQALRVLESDPIFAEKAVASLADEAADDSVLGSRARALNLYGDLSSGHKIVLLTVTRLVESVAEQTLVLIDEPESHLHPPLLSAFIRALSDLLVSRNGVAIIATHSPVVLQEVPRRCVWRLSRAGDVVTAERPDIETFGENVGTLTSEVFGLEVRHSGFHRLIAEAAAGQASYGEVLEAFGGQLGSEARALLQVLVIAQGRGY